MVNEKIFVPWLGFWNDCEDWAEHLEKNLDVCVLRGILNAGDSLHEIDRHKYPLFILNANIPIGHYRPFNNVDPLDQEGISCELIRRIKMSLRNSYSTIIVKAYDNYPITPQMYLDAGADMAFDEDRTSLDDFVEIVRNNLDKSSNL